VLIPLIVITFCATIMTSRIMELFKTPTSPSLDKVYESQIILRSRRLRVNGSRIPKESLKLRKYFFNNEETGIFPRLIKANENTSPMNMMMNPDALNMSSQFAMIISNLYFFVLYNSINHFFSGFVTVKLPFHLTIGWKSMFQQGIDIRDLDITYVSSSSWFILIFSGVRGFTSILLPMQIISGSIFKPDTNNVQQQPQNAMSMSNPSKQFLEEKENLQIYKHLPIIEKSSERLLKMEETAPIEIHG